MTYRASRPLGLPSLLALALAASPLASARAAETTAGTPAATPEASKPAPSKAEAAKPEAPKAEPQKAEPQKAEAENEGQTARASLADKIPPVSGNLFFRKGRFEITPAIGISLGDAFFQKYAFGLMLSYHLLESLAIGIHGSYLLNTAGSAVSTCNDTGACSSPTMDQLTKGASVPGHIQMLAGLDLAWTPFYGKVNVLAEKVLHFDTSVFIGGDVIQYGAYDPAATPRANKSTITGGGHLGIGERILFNESIALRIELRDYMYGATVSLPDTNGNPQTKFENQLMLEVGVSFFLGGGSKD